MNDFLNGLPQATPEQLLSGANFRDMSAVVDILEVSDMPGAVDLAARTLRIMSTVKRVREELAEQIVEVRAGWDALARFQAGEYDAKQLGEVVATVKPIELDDRAATTNSARRIASIGIRLARLGYDVEEAWRLACKCVPGVAPQAQDTALHIIKAQV